MFLLVGWAIVLFFVDVLYVVLEMWMLVLQSVGQCSNDLTISLLHSGSISMIHQLFMMSAAFGTQQKSQVKKKKRSANSKKHV